MTYWLWAYDCSRNFVYQPGHTDKKMKVDRKPNVSAHRTSASRKLSLIVSWLLALASMYQFSPDSQNILLPFRNKAAVFGLFVHELEMKQEPSTCSLSYFRNVWSSEEDVRHIKIRKHLRFAICDTCVELREQFEKARGNDKERQRLKNEIRRHVKFVRKQRRSYKARCDKAMQQPSEYLSLIFDAADQAAYGLPYFGIKSHSSDGYHVGTHLMGCLAHGHGAFAFSYLENCKHGTNTTIQAMYRVLSEMKAEGKSIPRKIYIQLDNTSKQNKSKFFLGWCGYLILMGICDVVLISFLPVGHTHEDIDQFFSRCYLLKISF